jgi:hypothetical protein
MRADAAGSPAGGPANLLQPTTSISFAMYSLWAASDCFKWFFYQLNAF